MNALQLKNFLKLFRDLLFPVQCIGCSKEGSWLCARCFGSIAAIGAGRCPFCEQKNLFSSTCENCKPSHGIDGAISCAPYSTELIQSLIHIWKYQGVLEATPYLARFVALALQKELNKARSFSARILKTGMQKGHIEPIASIPPILAGARILLNPIPLHPKKQKERGFNQSHLLAKELSKYKSLWRMAQALERIKRTDAQATLSGIDRAENVSGAFALRAQCADLIRGHDIVLVDDVITTGSTINAAAEVLKAAGASSVWALTICYGHPIQKNA